jgi:hypothetical protein
VHELLIPQNCQTPPKSSEGLDCAEAKHADVSQRMTLTVINEITISLRVIEAFCLIFNNKKALRLAVFYQLGSIVASPEKVGN